MHHVYEKAFENTPVTNLALVVDNRHRTADTHETTAIFAQEQGKKSNPK